MMNPRTSQRLSAAAKAVSASCGRAVAAFRQGQARMIGSLAALFFAQPQLKPIPVKRRRNRYDAR